MQVFSLIKTVFYSFVSFLWVLGMYSCDKEPQREICVKGTVIGQGCLTGSYAIVLEGKNSDYGIAENIAYDNVVETQNLPEEYKINGTVIYFTFTKPAEELGKYLTYCSSAPQIVLHKVSATACPISMHAQHLPGITE
jgi:hypothetical protein